MRHKGSINEESVSMKEEFFRVYKKILASSSFINLHKVIQQTIHTPTPRFYVSIERALSVIMQIIHGQDISHMSQSRIEMYTEIYNRAIEYANQHQTTIKEAVKRVILSPAPRFYINENYAVVMLHHLRKNQKRKYV